MVILQNVLNVIGVIDQIDGPESHAVSDDITVLAGDRQEKPENILLDVAQIAEQGVAAPAGRRLGIEDIGPCQLQRCV